MKESQRMNAHGKAGHITNSRGLFDSHTGAGKGDKPRELDKKKYDMHFESIDWTDSSGRDRKKHVVRIGKRTIIHYK